MTNPTEGCLDASKTQDSTSDHSVHEDNTKVPADDGSHVMTSVSPVLRPPEEGDKHHVEHEREEYRLYKRRFIGLSALVRPSTHETVCTSL